MPRIDGRFEGDLITMTQAEHILNLSNGALAIRLKKWGKLNRWTKKCGKYRLISVAKLENYEKLTSKAGLSIVAKKPYGWLTTEQAKDIVGCDHSVVWRALQSGKLRGVRRGTTFYYHPDDIEQLRLEFNNTPLPGWLEIKLFTDALGADRTSASLWLRKHYKVKQFKRPSDKQLANYAEKEALEAWKAYYQNRLTNGRQLSEAKLKELIELRAKGLSQQKVGEILGICQTTVSQIELGKIYQEAKMT